MELIIRKANFKDLEFLFNLRNEESVRKVSLHSELISLDTHRKWFEKKLASNDSQIFIAELDFQPIAQTRFDLINNNEEAEISIAVVKEFRGKGYGSKIIKIASAQFLKDFPTIKIIRAFINLGNESSLRGFNKAGYRLIGETDRGGLVRNEMILNR